VEAFAFFWSETSRFRAAVGEMPLSLSPGAGEFFPPDFSEITSSSLAPITKIESGHEHRINIFKFQIDAACHQFPTMTKSKGKNGEIISHQFLLPHSTSTRIIIQRPEDHSNFLFSLSPYTFYFYTSLLRISETIMPTSSLSSSLPSDTVIGSALFFLTAAWFARYQSKNSRPTIRRRSNLYHHDDSTDSTNDASTSSTTTSRAHQRFSAAYNDRTNRTLDKVGPRGQAALTPAIPYLKHFLKCLDDPCDEIDNPQGYSTWKTVCYFVVYI
jgi:hypothetical protein